MERLATDRRYFSRPARSLFNDIRIYFPMRSQIKVYAVIDSRVDAALQYLAQLPDDGLDINGNPRRCSATTRKGKPCQRLPLPGNEYCPSHQHLEESEAA